MTVKRNKMEAAGHLTRDPELRMTQSGVAVLKCSIAMNSRVKKGDEWEDEVDFLDFVIFGKRAEAFDRHFSKGQGVWLEGRLKLQQWNDKTSGAKRSKHELIVSDWQFNGEAKNGAAAPSETATGEDLSDIPF